MDSVAYQREQIAEKDDDFQTSNCLLCDFGSAMGGPGGTGLQVKQLHVYSVGCTGTGLCSR